MTQRNQGDQGVGVGEVFVDCTEKRGLPGFWIFRAGRQPRLVGAKTAPEGKNATRIKD